MKDTFYVPIIDILLILIAAGFNTLAPRLILCWALSLICSPALFDYSLQSVKLSVLNVLHEVIFVLKANQMNLLFFVDLMNNN